MVLADAVHVLSRVSRSGSRKPRKEFYAKLKEALLISPFPPLSYPALERIPNSVQLWKETVNRQRCPSPSLPRSRSYPLSVELRPALAHLEVPERAKAVLNKARKAVLSRNLDSRLSFTRTRSQSTHQNYHHLNPLAHSRASFTLTSLYFL